MVLLKDPNTEDQNGTVQSGKDQSAEHSEHDAEDSDHDSDHEDLLCMIGSTKTGDQKCGEKRPEKRPHSTEDNEEDEEVEEDEENESKKRKLENNKGMLIS